jgi:hypothetical protein
MATQIMGASTLVPTTSMEVQADPAVLVDGSPAQTQFFQALAAEMAAALGIQVSEVEITGVRPATSASGRRRAQQTVAVQVDFVIKSSDPTAALALLFAQLEDESSPLWSSEIMGTADPATLSIAFSCPAGLYRPRVWDASLSLHRLAGDCVECPGNMFPDPTNETRCQECEKLTVVSADKSGCVCADNYYDTTAGLLICYDVGEDFSALDFSPAVDDPRCVSCGDAGSTAHCVTCSGGLATHLKQGFARAHTQTHTPTDAVFGPLAIFGCPSPKGCPSQNFTEAECATGYSGKLCGVCGAGWVKSGGACISCADASVSVALVVALVAAAAVVRCLSTRWVTGEAERTAEQNTVGIHVSGLTVQSKILIGLLQVCKRTQPTVSIVLYTVLH